MSLLGKLATGLLFGKEGLGRYVPSGGNILSSMSRQFKQADQTVSSAIGKAITSRARYGNVRRMSALMGTSSIGSRIGLSTIYGAAAIGGIGLMDIGMENARAQYGDRYSTEFGSGGAYGKSISGLIGMYFGIQALFGRDFISRAKNTIAWRSGGRDAVLAKVSGWKQNSKTNILAFSRSRKPTIESQHARLMSLKKESSILAKEISEAKGTSNVYELPEFTGTPGFSDSRPASRVDAATFVQDRSNRLNSINKRIRATNRTLSSFQSQIGAPRNAIDDIFGAFADRSLYRKIKATAPSYGSARALAATSRALALGGMVGWLGMDPQYAITAVTTAGASGLLAGATGHVSKKILSRSITKPIGVEAGSVRAASGSFLGEAAMGAAIASVGAAAGIGLGLHMSDIRNTVAEGNITSMDQRSNIHKLNYSTAGLVQALHRNKGGF